MQSSLRVSDARSTFNGLCLGKVYHVYPEANMVDVQLLNGTLVEKAQVISGFASSKSGVAELPIPKYVKNKQEINMLDRDDSLAMANQDESDVFAVVGFLGGYLENAIVLGFLFPEENEILCGRDSKGNEDGSMFLWKHESGVYVRVAKGYKAAEGEDRDGHGGTQVTPDIEISHPSGTYLKIGQYDYAKNHPDNLAPITNWDSQNQIRNFNSLNPDSKTADPAPTIIINHSSGTYVVIAHDGEVFIKSEANLGIEVVGDMTEEVTGNLTRTYHGDVTEIIECKLDQTVTGKVTQTFQDDLETSVSGDVTEDITGSLDETIGSDLNKTVSGNETDSITGDWARSGATISDTGIVSHN